MTNLEFLQSLKTGTEVQNFLDHVHYGCMQRLIFDTQGTEEEKKYWKSHCLGDGYRGMNGCTKCHVEFWDREVIQ